MSHAGTYILSEHGHAVRHAEGASGAGPFTTAFRTNAEPTNAESCPTRSAVSIRLARKFRSYAPPGRDGASIHSHIAPT